MCVCLCCVLSDGGLWLELITRPEESYRVWCVWVWSSKARWWGVLGPLGAVQPWKTSSFILQYALTTIINNKSRYRPPNLCGELITHPEESYRLWCVVVCDLETSWIWRPWPTGGGGGFYANRKEIDPPVNNAFVYAIKFLRFWISGLLWQT
jgi:hypothetical protein